jgi:23S rRNA (uracil1939-C5)-methyltransferase
MEVTIERMLPGGLGLAHAEGKTVMVSLAAPGDRVRVRIDRVKGNVSFASIEEVIEPSPHRVGPPCPYFGRCGGCDFQQLTYQAQLDAKVEIIKDCLRRLGGIENVPDFQITAAPNQWHYRSRAQWQYDRVRLRLGYFESGSRNVCDVAACAVLVPELQTALEALRKQMQEGLLPEDARDFRAVLGDDDQISIAPSVRSPTSGSPAGQPGWGGAVREGNMSEPPAVAGGQSSGKISTIGEGPAVRDVTRTINGETYQLNAESFFQANDSLLPQLIDTAIGNATGETAIELYCGVGLFTLPLARRFKHVLGVEGDTAAANFARDNLANAGLNNAEIANQNVSHWLEDDAVAWLEEKIEGSDSSPLSDELLSERQPTGEPHQVAAPQSQPDFLLLDPPRTGAESRVIAGILNLRPRRISYVSCDPATLARDLKKLIAGGYNLDSIAAFDMFPQTHHVETVVQLVASPKLSPTS